MEELRRFLYLGPSLNLCDLNQSKPLIVRTSTLIHTLITEHNKGSLIIQEISNYFEAYSENFQTKKTRNNLECLTFALACCLVPTLDESFTHSVYKTLHKITSTPYYLFSFEYFRKFLLKTRLETMDGFPSKKVSSHGGIGLKKVINKWYNSIPDMDLIHMVTRYKSSYLWTNKDLFKLYHIKPHSEGVNIIVKYTMFGYDKVKNTNSDEYQDIMEFIDDLESLKVVEDEDKVVELIRRHNFKLEHLPLHLRHSCKIWTALTEKMSFQEFCELIHIYAKNDIIRSGSDTENFILDTLINPTKNDQLKLTNPIYPSFAIQMYHKLTQLNLVKDMEQLSLASSFNTTSNDSKSTPNSSPDKSTKSTTTTPDSKNSSHNSSNNSSKSGLRSWNTSLLSAKSGNGTIGYASNKIVDSLWNAFMLSIDHHKSLQTPLKLKVALTVENSSHMNNDSTSNLTCLSPKSVSKCVMLTMHYSCQNIDMFILNDKFNKMNNLDKDLNFENLKNSFSNIPLAKNQMSDEMAEWPGQNEHDDHYEAFIFLTASHSRNAIIRKNMIEYRLNKNSAAKLVLVNLSKRRNSNMNVLDNLEANKLELTLNGWQFDYQFIIDAFLREKFL